MDSLYGDALAGAKGQRLKQRLSQWDSVPASASKLALPPVNHNFRPDGRDSYKCALCGKPRALHGPEENVREITTNERNEQ